MISSQPFPNSKRYEIMYSHCGDPSELYSSFYCDNDEEAKEKVRKLKEAGNFSWGYESLDRIDVEEVRKSLNI